MKRPDPIGRRGSCKMTSILDWAYVNGMKCWLKVQEYCKSPKNQIGELFEIWITSRFHYIMIRNKELTLFDWTKKTYFLGLLRLLSPFHSRRFWWLGNHLTQRSMEGDVSLCVRLKPGYDEERKPTSKGVVCCFHTKQFLSQGSFKGGHLKNDRSLFIQVDTVSSKSQTFQSEASNWLFRNPGAFVHLWFG